MSDKPVLLLREMREGYARLPSSFSALFIKQTLDRIDIIDHNERRSRDLPALAIEGAYV